MKSNCVFYALTAWLRKTEPGHESYLLIRRSRVKWGIVHFLHGKLDHDTGHIKVTSYKPRTGQEEKRGVEVVFDGRVKDGDRP